MSQSYKIEKVKKLKEELKDYNSFIFTNYRGLSVQQLNSLRNALTEKGVEFHVVKNRTVKRVFHELGLSDFDQFLVNPTALAYFKTDISEIAKILIDTTKDTTLQLKGGFANNVILTTEDIVLISKLPSRESLIAQAIGLLNAPRAGLVFVLNVILTKFVTTLKSIESQKLNQANIEY